MAKGSVQLETGILLKESRQRAHLLQQQKEEILQNAEEIQATQEEMERQTRERRDEIHRLKKQLSNGVVRRDKILIRT